MRQKPAWQLRMAEVTNVEFVMFNFNIFEIQRVDSELLSKRAARAYSQMPLPGESIIERAVETVRYLFGKQPKLAVQRIKTKRTDN